MIDKEMVREELNQSYVKKDYPTISKIAELYLAGELVEPISKVEKMTLGYCVSYNGKIELDATNGRLEIYYNRVDAEKQAQIIKMKIGNFNDYEIHECEILFKEVIL